MDGPNWRRPTGARCSTGVVADKTMVTGYHFGLPGAGKIKKDGKGYAFVPVKAA